MKNIRKHLLAAAAGTVMALGATSSAMAAANTQFTINPSVLGGPAGNPMVSYLQVAAAELLKPNGSFTGHTASGVIGVTAFMPVSGPLPIGGTGLNTAYNLYMTFDLVDTLASGSFNTAGSTYSMSMLNVKFWADLDSNTIVNGAGSENGTGVSGNTGAEASVTGTTSDDVLLAVADIVSGTGFLNPAAGGGLAAELKATLNFALCTGAGTAQIGGSPGGKPTSGNLSNLANGTTNTGIGPAAGCTSDLGNQFFSAPKPFYELAFAAFTNTQQNATPNADGTIAINNSGQLDFGRVPEPGSLALLGLGLFGIGAMSKRRKS